MTTGAASITAQERQALIQQGREILYRETQANHDKVKEAVKQWRDGREAFAQGAQNADGMYFDKKTLTWKASLDEVNNTPALVEGHKRYHFMISLFSIFKKLVPNEPEQRAIGAFLQHKLLKYTTYKEPVQLMAPEGNYFEAAQERIDILLGKLDNKTFKSSFEKKADRRFGFKMDAILHLRLGQEKFEALAKARQDYMVHDTECINETCRLIQQWYTLKNYKSEIKNIDEELNAILQSQTTAATQEERNCLQGLQAQKLILENLKKERTKLRDKAKRESKLLTAQEVQEVFKVKWAKALRMFNNNPKIIAFLQDPQKPFPEGQTPFWEEKFLIDEIVELKLQIRLGQDTYQLIYEREMEYYLLPAYSPEDNQEFFKEALAVFSKEDPTEPNHIRFQWQELFKSLQTQSDVYTPELEARVSKLRENLQPLTFEEEKIKQQFIDRMQGALRDKVLAAEVQHLVKTGKLPEPPPQAAVPPKQTIEAELQSAPEPAQVQTETKPQTPIEIQPVAETKPNVEPIKEVAAPPVTPVKVVAPAAPIEQEAHTIAPVKEATPKPAAIKPKKLPFWKRIGNCISKWWNKFINLFKREKI